MTTIETISALDVQDGDVIVKYGYRCRASKCRFSAGHDGVVVKSFVLTSEPDARFPDPLPNGFDGGVYGGSKHAVEFREVAAPVARITTSHYRFYVTLDGENVATFRFLKDAIAAYPGAVLDVPESVRKCL